MRMSAQDVIDRERRLAQGRQSPPSVTQPSPAKAKDPKAKLFAKGRLPAGVMNKTEEAYSQYLDQRKQAGEILWWAFEAIKFKLANNRHLTVDFAVMLADGQLEMHDTKGARAITQEDSKVKMQWAAQRYPFAFFLVYPRKAADGGGYDIEEVRA